jgi:multiple sugar transport system substrate-binding protein
VLWGSVIVASSSILSACGSAPQAAPTSAPATAAPTAAPTAAATQPAPAVTPTAAPAAQATPGKKAAEIVYQTRDLTSEDHLRKKYGPQFTQETGTKVTIQDIPNAQYFDKVPILYAANQLGDLCLSFTYRYVPAWVVKDILKSIDDYVASEKLDLSQWYPGVIQGSRFEGKLYGLANTGHANETSLFFNRTMLDKAGIKAPDAASPDDTWKWDDLVSYGKELTQTASGKTSVWGYYAIFEAFSSMNVNLRTFGSDHIGKDGLTAICGNDQGKAAYRYYQDLMYKHNIRPKPTDLTPNESVYQLFGAGKVAIFQDGTYPVTTLDSFVQKKFEFGGFIRPPGPGGTRGATVFGNLTSLTTQAKETETAYQFMRYVTTKDAGIQKLFMGTGSAGARPDVFTDPKVLEAYPWYKIGDKIMRETIDYNLPQNVRVLELEKNVPQVEQEIWLNKIGAEDGAVKVQEAINAILKQPR